METTNSLKETPQPVLDTGFDVDTCIQDVFTVGLYLLTVNRKIEGLIVFKQLFELLNDSEVVFAGFAMAMIENDLAKEVLPAVAEFKKSFTFRSIIFDVVTMMCHFKLDDSEKAMLVYDAIQKSNDEACKGLAKSFMNTLVD